MDKLIQLANRNLKARGLRVALERSGDVVRVRGTFPAKSGEVTPRQRRITLGKYGQLDELIGRAIEIGEQLRDGCFVWSTPPVTWGDMVGSFESSYFEKRGRNKKVETTWRYDFYEVLKRLPLTETASNHSTALHALIERVWDKPRSRNRACFVVRAFAQYHRLDLSFDPQSLRVKNTPKPIIIPTDEEIVAVWDSLKEGSTVRSHYGLIATYGIRPHECYRVTSVIDSAEGAIKVCSNSKTGSRICYPLPLQWCKRVTFISTDESERDNRSLGRLVSQAFNRAGLPFTPYALRHAWCVRSSLTPFPPGYAARWAGHSERLHNGRYQDGASIEHHSAAYRAGIANTSTPH